MKKEEKLTNKQIIEIVTSLDRFLFNEIIKNKIPFEDTISFHDLNYQHDFIIKINQTLKELMTWIKSMLVQEGREKGKFELQRDIKRILSI